MTIDNNVIEVLRYFCSIHHGCELCPFAKDGECKLYMSPYGIPEDWPGVEGDD